jgi:hypothetical protein
MKRQICMTVIPEKENKALLHDTFTLKDKVLLYTMQYN